ncbi:hypothetical protein [Aneurinibacillus migulanus]|uniref:Uncharacterized protein n=1 Tax=Aneurinibacillus migulanus TaxID=47500 RepID=A0A0D1XZJ1_ANEMI|nr:hypothetical protein [Aneurinibacillus migulanus]KIV59611.1 hypothetical protein TS65_02760 [Aneurinibacillus migulanus]KON93140.1 hypothetical protein AF333_26105 [Aneurinibacillus migulanus]MED0890960.1 hypothetical protein [Aneurinibacillus migulanus]MED1614601.1 hypothetical protein [Aneurinibacillus migulanus]SDK30506.1 hypothetical protein SAMN04487909_14815 [Aneurinibacillus migulanus]
MMDIGKRVWAEIINRIYPNLPVSWERDMWQTGQFMRPSAFIEADLISEKMYTRQSVRIVEDVRLVFHYEYEQIDEQERGEPIPFDLAPFFMYLRQQRYCVASKQFKTMLVIEPPRTQEKSDRMEVMFQYSYLLHVPKSTATDRMKINDFYVEFNGKEVKR